MGTIEPGLYLVSTPIGNLEDITLRALRVLSSVDLIAAEDTRKTRRLLDAHCIKAQMISLHDHNKEKRAPGLLKRLANGESIAIVSEAGTPGISDPGYYLVKLALSGGVRVIPVPGACSIVAAIVASGLPTDRFLFEGFLPRKAGRRQKKLTELVSEPRTIVIFESPQRLLRTLEELKKFCGSRPCVVAREMTKRFEEFARGTVEEVLEHYRAKSVKGEIVILLKGDSDDTRACEESDKRSL
jgi:16S rRNA (cytidine1402-2'-O)-methyltransferase